MDIIANMNAMHVWDCSKVFTCFGFTECKDIKFNSTELVNEDNPEFHNSDCREKLFTYSFTVFE